MTDIDIIIPENWWNDLEPQWKQAFRIFISANKREPDSDDLENIFSTQTIRLAGPKAPFPNMQFELTNLSGLQYLRNLTIVIVTHHKVEHIEVLRNLTNLKSLFLFNNNIESLTGIEELMELEQLYVQCNQISSLEPVEKLVNLKELYISDNSFKSLDGLTEMHSDKLTMFVCRPNENLKQKEIIRTERDLGIICR
ncbi:MAG: leucine-rich repeat domain-containing protein [Ginsengibacter sp.]